MHLTRRQNKQDTLHWKKILFLSVERKHYKDNWLMDIWRCFCPVSYSIPFLHMHGMLSMLFILVCLCQNYNNNSWYIKYDLLMMCLISYRWRYHNGFDNLFQWSWERSRMHWEFTSIVGQPGYLHCIWNICNKTCFFLCRGLNYIYIVYYSLLLLLKILRHFFGRIKKKRFHFVYKCKYLLNVRK